MLILAQPVRNFPKDRRTALCESTRVKRQRRALVFVLLILTHVAGAWLCVVFYMWFPVVVLRAAFKSGALSFVFERARKRVRARHRALIEVNYVGQLLSVGLRICW